MGDLVSAVLQRLNVLGPKEMMHRPRPPRREWAIVPTPVNGASTQLVQLAGESLRFPF